MENLGRNYERNDVIVLEGAIYRDCSFKSVDFSGQNFRETEFESCLFEKFDLSLIDLSDAKLHQVEYKDCRIQGIIFFEINPLIVEMNFIDCQIRECNFSGLVFKGNSF